jgi:hypothetical protein
VKNENIKTKISLFIFLAFLVVALFCFVKKSFADEKHLIINEIQISGGTGKTENDFVELYNPTDSSINLKGYLLVKRTKTGDSDTTIFSWTSDTLITSKSYYLWANNKNGFSDKLEADCNSDEIISNDNGIGLRDGDKKIIDSVGWGDCKNIFVETTAFQQNPTSNKSIARENFKDSDNNSKDFSLQNKTSPTNSSGGNSGESDDSENDSNKDDKSKHSGKVILNEIFPAPKTSLGEEEFVEIKNNSDEAIDFSSWTIEDSRGTKAKISKRELNGRFYVFYGSFSLNNDSRGDAVFLYDEKKNLVDSQSYASTKTSYAYAFDGTAWQWTSKVTKGAGNQFDKLLSGKIKKDKKIYANVFANFEVKADNNAQKFTWNFGDGHKSYLKKTRHKYEKSGNYEATLKITGDGKENLLSFNVKVEKFGKTKVRIIALSANPTGKDSENE